MGERFTNLYQISNNLYFKNAPIIIVAGSLLKDEITGSLVVQMKYQSISEKKIKALKINIIPIDVEGKNIVDEVEYQYLDLNVRAGQEFGDNKAIILQNRIARSFEIKDITIVFTDDTKWCSNNQIKSLIKSQKLEVVLNDMEMVKQYRLATNKYATYKPIDEGDLWFCSCGVWNKSHHCENCSTNREQVFSSYNLDVLKEALANRIAEEKEQARLAKEKAEAEEAERKRKLKKIMLICTPIIIVMTIILLLIVTRVDRIKGRAREAIDKGDYLLAIEILDEIEGESGVLDLQEEVQQLMSDEISMAINDKEYEKVVKMMNDYSDCLEESVINTHKKELQKVCPHKSVINEKKEATCEKNGYSNDICELCGYIEETIVDALGHKFSSKITKEATCDEDGNEHKICGTCGYEEDNSIKKLGHSYEKKDIVKPTCDKEGKCQYTCKKCGDNYSEEVNAMGHNWSAATCTAAKKCNTCGKTEGSILEHNWKTDMSNIDRPIKCSMCSISYPANVTLKYKGFPYDREEVVYVESITVQDEYVYTDSDGEMYAGYTCKIKGYAYDDWISIYISVEEENGSYTNYGLDEVTVLDKGEFVYDDIFFIVPINGTYIISIDGAV